MMNDHEQNIQRVSFAMHGHVGVLTMQHHEQHNALSPLQVKAFLAAHAESLAQHARALVITSSDKHFCAGADINEFLKGQLLDPNAPVGEYAPMVLFKTLIEDSRPIIAAVNGAALGGGVEVVLCSDLVLASSAAKFGMPEISLGVLPRTATVRLSEIIGRRRALEMILTRRRIDAQEALSWGLINRVCQDEHLVSDAIALANDIITAPPTIIGAVKRNLGRINPKDWQAIHQLLGEMDPREWREGLTAFKEKRPVDFEQFWQKSS
jgi:enoyl-CoA hydratase/carnithine racemase